MRRGSQKGEAGASPGTDDGGAGAVDQPHTPVLLAEVLDAMALTPGGRCVDATFGAGGYTRAILDADPTGQSKVTAFDRDPAAIAAGAVMSEAYGPRLDLINRPFSELLENVTPPIDATVFDLGVSSMQLDQPERGFSFQADGPLDMRMGGDGASAADLVNTQEEAVLADILFNFGEERRSRAIARRIVADRAKEPILTTGSLARLVETVLGGRRAGQKHPATRTFQALRIAVNSELDEVVAGLSAAEMLLAPGGRLVVVTFHSLEDRIAKRFLTERTGRGAGRSRHLPETEQLRPPSFRLVNQRPLTASKDELARNPRSRSAKLRVAERLDAEPWPVDARKLGVPRHGW